MSLDRSTPMRRAADPGTAECAVDGCTRNTRRLKAVYCEMHYYRLRRTGTTADPGRITGPCSVEGCDSAAVSRTQLCRMHYLRHKKRGDVHFELKNEQHHRWTAGKVSYSGMHQRLRKMLGLATQHLCVDCGKPASQWSYDHRHPAAKIDGATGLLYVSRADNYEPRCSSCHKKFDQSHRVDETPVRIPKVAIEAVLPSLRDGSLTVRNAASTVGCSSSQLVRRGLLLTKLAVLSRDGDACIRCGSTQSLDAHHRKPRAMGGGTAQTTFSLANIITLCRTHHGEVESKRDWAIVHGWLVGQAQDPALVPVLHARHGWVRLTDDGGVTPA